MIGVLVNRGGSESTEVGDSMRLLVPEAAEREVSTTSVSKISASTQFTPASRSVFRQNGVEVVNEVFRGLDFNFNVGLGVEVVVVVSIDEISVTDVTIESESVAVRVEATAVEVETELLAVESGVSGASVVKVVSSKLESA